MRGLVLPFLLRRAPKSDSFVLGHKNIYVFFCREGLLFALLLLVTFVTGVNYGNNLVLGLFFYLLSIWLVSCVVGFVQLLRLSVKLDLAQLCQAQSLCWVQVVVSQKDHKTAHQLIFDFYPKIPDLSWLDPKDKEIFLAHKTQRIALVSGEHVLRLPVLAPVRGAVVLPPLTIKSRYPLGVMQAWGYGHFLGTGQAYPVPLATGIDTQTGGGLGEAMRTGQEDFDRLDSYESGESLSRVSWTHVARGMGMLTKHFGEPMGSAVVLDYKRMPAQAHEDKLGQLAFLVLQQKGYFVLCLPSGTTAGEGAGFVEASLCRLAQEP